MKQLLCQLAAQGHQNVRKQLLINGLFAGKRRCSAPRYVK
jgi:hypothetical protein